MALCSAIPYLASVVIYFGVYRTFPRDKAKVLAESQEDHRVLEEQVVNPVPSFKALDLPATDELHDQL